MRRMSQVCDCTRVGSYDKNRVDESITEEDYMAAEGDESLKWDLRLQTLFVWVYGWQDRLIEKLDFMSRKLAGVSETDEA